ncbi:alpha carbonic anhydrase 7 [Citrus sinensis]|nr:alpha carbonic anhydrase 7 [Citrus sinensis]
MEKIAIQVLFCCFFVVLLLLSGTAISQEVDDEIEFNYEEGGENGPSKWGQLHSEWSACKNGRMQSPIDLLNERVQVVSHLGRLKRSYKPSNATLKNRGHDMMLQWEGGAGTLRINGTEYVLQQCHWHSPSEHTINGQRFALEAHMVHVSQDGKIAVVGIVYKIGRPDSFLESVRTVTREQVRSLRVAVHDESDTNARPQQPINLRIVKSYRPDDENQNP